MSKSVSFENPSQVTQEKDALFNPATKSGWLFFVYTTPNTLRLEKKGNGGVSEWVNLLQDDQISYVLFRLYEEVDLQNIKHLNTTDVLMTWIGPKVGIIERGKKKGHVPDVSKFLQPHKIDLEAINKANITEENVRKRCKSEGGSHVID